MRPARILLCYDGSADAKRAIERAATTFGPRAATVVTVGDPAVQSVASEGAKLAERHGLAPVEPLVLRPVDTVWETILDAATRFGAAAIVLGAHGRSGTRSALLGSVSDHVVHHARRPVFVVRDDVSGGTSGRALIAYDGSEDARLAIDYAGQVLGARSVVVLAVWQDPHAALSHSWAGLSSTPDLTEVSAAAGRAAKLCVDEGIKLAEAAGLVAEPLVRKTDGPVWPTVLETAEQLDADVIVLGSRGLSGIRTVMLGSVSDAVLHHSRRPALVVRHGAISDPAPGIERVPAASQAS
jgi:nucleotide-binding universal stress UspA family protein